MILVEEGQGPVILCLPNSGTEIPDAVFKRLNATGRLQADLSWQLDRLFDFHHEPDVTVVRSTISRYVVDLDKDPETPVSAAFDPSVALCPATTLDSKRIYQEGEEPGPTEVEQRILLFHVPFHRALRQQVDRLLSKHRKVVVVDCQSIRSHIKGMIDDELPLVSIGSADGMSCDPDLRNLVVGSFSGLEGMSVGVDRHARGGLITETFGRPDLGLHALTLLLAQRSYLRHESPPFEPDKAALARLRTILSDSISMISDWAMGYSDIVGFLPPDDPPPATAQEPEDNAAANADPDPDPGSDAEEAAAGSAACEGGEEPGPTRTGAKAKSAQAEAADFEDIPAIPLLVAE